MKRIIKNIVLLTILSILAFTHVSADVSGYVTLDEITSNNESVAVYNNESNIIEYYISNSQNFSLKLQGYDLSNSNSDQYIKVVITTPGGYSENSTTYNTLNTDGFVESYEENPGAYNMYYPYFILELREITSQNIIPIRVSSEDYNGIKVYFVDPDVFEQLDSIFNQMTNNGVLEINSIKPSKPEYSDTMITSALSSYNTDDYTFMGYCDYENIDECYIEFYSNDTDDILQKYPVTYSYKTENKIISSKINEYVSNIEELANEYGNEMGSILCLEDLENINYLYSILKHPTTSMDEVNAVIHYSSKIKELLGYSNIEARFDMRMGEDASLYSMANGFMTLSFDGVVYGVASYIGYERINVIYVPDDTQNTRSALIEKAKERLESYLKDATINISYEGQISSLESYEQGFIDTTKTNGEYFTVSLDDQDYSFFIVRDSSKIQTPQLNTVDALTNIKINTDDSAIPLDTKVEAKLLSKDSNEYKELIKKLKVTDGISVDLKMFSDTAQTYITKLDNGKFRIYIPLGNDYKNKELRAYYLKDDGTIEKYDVTYESGFGVFETNHFSTYTIADGTKVPQTFDGILSYLALLLLSMIALFIVKSKVR